MPTDRSKKPADAFCALQTPLSEVSRKGLAKTAELGRTRKDGAHAVKKIACASAGDFFVYSLSTYSFFLWYCDPCYPLGIPEEKFFLE